MGDIFCALRFCTHSQQQNSQGLLFSICVKLVVSEARELVCGYMRARISDRAQPHRLVIRQKSDVGSPEYVYDFLYSP